MKKTLFPFVLLALLLTGCQNESQQNPASDNEEVANIVDEKMYNINYLFEAPIAVEKHDLTTVIKVVFTERSGSIEDTIAIDVRDNKIYLEPSISDTGIEARTGSVPITDADQVIDLLEKHHVQDWKVNPDHYSTDEIGWNLWLQFEDGTVERYGGSGTAPKMTQSTYEAFALELREFVDARVITIDPKPQ